MSKVGKVPITLPSGVEITIGQDNTIAVKGPKGQLSEKLHPKIRLAQKDGTIEVSVAHPDNRSERALWGLGRALVANMVAGVSEGFSKQLEINGVGYKAAVQGKKLVLHVGFSHQVDFLMPEGIEAAVEKNVVTISGVDKQLVGEIAAQVRKVRPPEPYKGKGIRYIDEVVRRKAGKVAKSAE
ncbi:MAG: 50S ribosomal protein L6 [bacterium]|nr:50S ribosomal protein L6 [bacterium]